ncbi:MAG: hypothetical protein ABSG17_02305 [Spirochaetia bacterium]|jgi:hypothetical protein
MKRALFILFVFGGPMLGFAQVSGGGIQFSGVLSANLIDDFNSNTAYSDNNNGYTYFQLNGSFKDGPFGLESQFQFGPSPGAGVQNLYIHYGYGYANLFGGVLYLAVGRVVDLSTFGLNSYYQQSPNGPGVYGTGVGKIGSSGFGVDGIQLKIIPAANLVFGVVMPYNILGFPIVNSTFRATKITASYTIPKVVQVVLGYQQHLVGVADYVAAPQPPALFDPNGLLNKNKAYVLANLLVSENLTAGVRYELDHDVSAVEIISHNLYATVGDKIGNFSIGADAGVYIPPGGSAGLEVLGATSYTFPAALPSVDIQPYVQAGFFTSGYPLVSDLTGVSYTNGFTNDNFFTVNPQLKFLLGKSQHELELGYTLTYDLNAGQIILDQFNVMMQIYF